MRLEGLSPNFCVHNCMPKINQRFPGYMLRSNDKVYMIMTYHITQNFSDRKLLQLYGRLFFRHKTFVVAYDRPKDYACDGNY